MQINEANEKYVFEIYVFFFLIPRIYFLIISITISIVFLEIFFCNKPEVISQTRACAAATYADFQKSPIRILLDLETQFYATIAHNISNFSYS